MHKKYFFTFKKEEIMVPSFMERYHFDRKDRELVESVGMFLSGLITAPAVIQYEEQGVCCGVTLGATYDELEALVMNSGNLLMSYCMECYGMELLSKAYQKMNEAVFAQTGKWMGTYHFLGVEEEEKLQDFLAGIRREWNEEEGPFLAFEKGMLKPLKSVVFTAPYRDKREESGCHSCEQCENRSCSFRKTMESASMKKRKPIEQQIEKQARYSYGVSRIMDKSLK